MAKPLPLQDRELASDAVKAMWDLFVLDSFDPRLPCVIFHGDDGNFLVMNRKIFPLDMDAIFTYGGDSDRYFTDLYTLAAMMLRSKFLGMAVHCNDLQLHRMTVEGIHYEWQPSVQWSKDPTKIYLRTMVMPDGRRYVTPAPPLPVRAGGTVH